MFNLKNTKMFFNKLFRLFTTLLAITFLIATTVILLIAVYHTVIILISFLNNFSPIFLEWVGTSISVFICVLTSPIHNLMFLIVTFFCAVVVFAMAQIEFLALTFLIVYVGAIAILFLFVIMLLNVKELTKSESNTLTTTQLYAIFWNGPIVIVSSIVGEHISISSSNKLISSEIISNFVNREFYDIFLFSELLYSYYSYLFLLAGFLLLTAMLGAIILATYTVSEDEN